MSGMIGLHILKKVSGDDDDLVAEAEEAFHKRKPSQKRWSIFAACLCLIVLCSVPVLVAAGNESAYEMLYSISPQLAQRLKPINASCIDNGIEMTVLAAGIDDDKAAVLISLRDITDSRLDETTDLFDCYNIHAPFDYCAGCSLVEYDADKHTATFLVTIKQMDRALIPGDKITFSVSQILYGIEGSTNYIARIETDNIPVVTEFIRNPDLRGESGSQEIKLMLPDETNAKELKQGVTLTGIGLINDELHVQLRYDHIIKSDKYRNVYLKDDLTDKSGIIQYCLASHAFWDDSHTYSYEEYVFAIPTKEKIEYEIWGDFRTCNNDPIEGNWQVTFQIERSTKLE